MLLTENLSHLSDSPHLVVLVRVIFVSKAVMSWMTKGAEVFEAVKLDELVGGGEAIEIVLLAVLRVTMQLEFMLMMDKSPGRRLLLILTLLGKEELL